ncbi:hypothetical protein SLEP1_g10464 [Rubroshorea leprosula]|uniref:Uncharacterized protein n=1 Tax=Rubroshorea leprosula TaxID=152421 RepID=A0AAV5IJH4_9ROSI|nr:hypothetical protein SLEP1_g10464 [Rubroshorea leprosula]
MVLPLLEFSSGPITGLLDPAEAPGVNRVASCNFSKFFLCFFPNLC